VVVQDDLPWPGRTTVASSPDRYLSVSSNQDRFPFNRHFFAAIKDLKRAPVEPDVEITPRGDHELVVRLEAPAYAYFVHLEVPHEATRFSDNYFDLAPGEGREVLVTNEQRRIKPEMVRVRWR
jgi:beta-mannosidase